MTNETKTSAIVEQRASVENESYTVRRFVVDHCAPERIELWDAIHAYARASYSGEERGPSSARMDAVLRVENAVAAVRTTKPEPARLDADRSAKPKTEIVGVVAKSPDARTRTLCSDSINEYVVRATEPPDFDDIARATLEEHGGALTEGILAHELAMAYEAGQQDPEECRRPVRCALTPELPPGKTWAVQVVRRAGGWATVFSVGAQHFTIAESPEDGVERAYWFARMFGKAMGRVIETERGAVRGPGDEDMEGCSECGGTGVTEEDATGALGYVVKRSCSARGKDGGDLTKEQTIARLCALLGSVWEHLDPAGETPNDCFCGRYGLGPFRSTGAALRWVEEVVRDALLSDVRASATQASPGLTRSQVPESSDVVSHCANCGYEVDEPHTWKECAERLQRECLRLVNAMVDSDRAADDRVQRAREEEREACAMSLVDAARKGVSTDAIYARRGAEIIRARGKDGGR